jgi:hypothetical protein
MSGRAAARRDAAFAFAYPATLHSRHNGRDHGHLLSKATIMVAS